MADQHENQPALIMFVDDNVALLYGVGQLLELEGYEVMLAEDGVEALQKLESAETIPHLIISDIAMPKMDGFELFRAIRQHEEWVSIQFLFLTAFDQADYVEKAYELDPEAYLVKPFDEMHMLRLIRSRLRRREDWLRHIELQQRLLDGAKRDLATMVSHELRTPLVSMNIVTDMLSEEVDKMGPVQVRELVEMMQSGSIRLTRLVEQMVMYVQLRSGSMTGNLRDYFRPRRAIDAVSGAIKIAQQHDYRQRRVPVEQVTADPEVWIHCDLSSLQHALAEVIMNAVAFSDPAEPVVVRQSVVDDSIRITVSDSGPGIAPDEHSQIFEPYYQINRKKTEQQGMGIGLTLAKEIIDAHDGVLEVDSVVGQGTSVTFVLPIYSVDDE